MGRVTKQLPKGLVRGFALEGSRIQRHPEAGLFTLEADYLTGTWRHGTEHTVVMSRGGAGGTDYWAFDYRISGGDGEWKTFDDEGDTVTCYQVELVTKTSYEYREVAQP